MKLVQLNTSNNGSTGKIMIGIDEVARKNQIESYIICANSRTSNLKKISNQILVGNRIERNIHLQIAKYTGYNDCFSNYGTKRLLRKLDKINPDIIHLHNLHNCWLNLKLLFSYIKEKKIRVIWTLHDCWAFTAYCPYFDLVQCNKWKTQCYDCKYKGYPKGLVDRSSEIYNMKKNIFTGVEDMTIVTPSEWLKNLVEQSYLNKYKVKVINNGINLNTFFRRKSDFRKKYKLDNKFIILGVAFSWGYRKGLDIFEWLSSKLDDNYKIVLVGVDKELSKKLPKNILTICKTENQEELAEIYSAADVFLNPTREDNFPTVNIEALACGTPVLTFDTGGSPECLSSKTGSIVNKESLLVKLSKLKLKNYNVDDCLKRGQEFNEQDKFYEYIKLYLE